MSNHDQIDRQVMEAIGRTPSCELDDIACECVGLTWNQVFLAIDRLSREGTVQLEPRGRGRYAIQLYDKAQDAVLEPAPV